MSHRDTAQLKPSLSTNVDKAGYKIMQSTLTHTTVTCTDKTSTLSKLSKVMISQALSLLVVGRSSSSSCTTPREIVKCTFV